MKNRLKQPADQAPPACPADQAPPLRYAQAIAAAQRGKRCRHRPDSPRDRDYGEQVAQAGGGGSCKTAEDPINSQGKPKDEIIAMTRSLDESLAAMDDLNARLKHIESQKSAVRPKPITEKSPVSAEDFSKQLEKLLQVSMGDLEQRLSQNIINLLKELPASPGPAREVKLKAIQEAVISEAVDFSKLFSHNEIKSNIDEAGIDEFKSKGINESLKKLRGMK